MDLATDSSPALAGLAEMYFINLADNEVDSLIALPPKAALVLPLMRIFLP